MNMTAIGNTKRKTDIGRKYFIENLHRTCSLTETKSLIAGRCGLACQLPDQIHFGLPIGRSVGAQHLVKPHWRLVENVRMLPRFPRKISLRFARNKSPIDGSHALLL